jgi:predicted permease
MTTLLQDLRYGLRGLRRSPGFTLAAVLTLALGMGANTAVFSIAEAVLLRPLPYPDAGRLVRVWALDPRTGGGRDNLNPLDFADYRRQARSFSAIAGMAPRRFVVAGDAGDAEPERVRGARVSGGFFRVLGVRAALGRTLLPADEAPGAPEVAVLSHELWRRRFHADPGLIDRAVVLDDAPVVVAGVLPAGFRAPALAGRGTAIGRDEAPQIYRPLRIEETMGRGGHWLIALGRLAPGVPARAAQTEMDALARGLDREHPDHPGKEGWGVRLQDLRDALVGDTRAPLLLLTASVWLLLLIACVNVANLLLVRAAARRHEMAVRVALGAGLPRLVRQALTESALLAALGAAAGLALAWAALRLLPRLAPGTLPRLDEVGLDPRALAYAGGLAALTGLLFGLLPALRAARARVAPGLRAGGRSGLARRLPAALVVGELALALVLLVGAGLLLVSFGRLLAVDPGFRPRNVLTVEVELPETRYPEPFQAAAFFQALAERTAKLPGVESAAAVDILPFSGGYNCNSFAAEGVDAALVAAVPCAEYRAVTPGFFHTLGIDLVAGRDFASTDGAGKSVAPVAIINETLARALWPGRSPLGRTITLGFEEERPHTVIGVARDVRQQSLAAQAAPEVYVSTLQHPASAMTLVLRARRDPAALAAPVRAAVRGLDRQLPVGRAVTMEELLADSVAQPRLRTGLLFLFAALSLALAAVGVSGVITAAVERRRQEIGVRMALGADRAAVLRLIVGQTLAYTAVGLALGLGASLAAARLLAGLLFGVSAAHPPVFLVSGALLALVALAAGYLPAERASRMEPGVALE